MNDEDRVREQVAFELEAAAKEPGTHQIVAMAYIQAAWIARGGDA